MQISQYWQNEVMKRSVQGHEPVRVGWMARLIVDCWTREMDCIASGKFLKWTQTELRRIEQNW